MHYVVLECMDSSYHTFPEGPCTVYGTLRHAWVLVRNNRPHVPVI